MCDINAPAHSRDVFSVRSGKMINLDAV